MRRYTRLTNAHSKKFENHCGMVALYTVWYNFVRINMAAKMAPEMVAGMSKTLWTMDKIVALIDAAASAPNKRSVQEADCRGIVEAETCMAECCGCTGPKDLTHTTPEYRRALWIVMGLNVGYGVIEMFGGFIAGSQALKADALDFLGDGSITLVGLLALSWGLLWRARVAMLQGAFLALLGIGVLASTAYRAFFTLTPQAEVMGAFAVVALAVNVAAAMVLMKHRDGDANVRAVWLFSRNDGVFLFSSF